MCEGSVFNMAVNYHQRTRAIGSILDEYWSTVYDAGPLLMQSLGKSIVFALFKIYIQNI